VVAYGFKVKLSGPVVEGRAVPVVHAMAEAALVELADYTRFEVLMQLDRVLQHPTGYYESQVRPQRVAVDTYSVNDSNVIYGPWLEGISSRNRARPGFPGYHTFRTVRGRMAQKADQVAEAAVQRMIGELE
jgi:hypothetical protein